MRPSVMLTGLGFILVAGPWLPNAGACIVRHAEVQEAMERAESLVVARVDKSRELSGPAQVYDKTVQYTLLIEEVLGGKAEKKRIEPSYSRPLAHRRKGQLVCPLLLGSGLEYELKPGERYLFLLTNSRILRAEPLSKKESLANDWKQHGSIGLYDSERLADAQVVLRVKLLKAQGGSKYHWDRVEPINVIKNETKQPFGRPFDVAHRGRDKGVPENTSTIYLVPYGDGRTGRWMLLGGKAETGVSHPTE